MFKLVIQDDEGKTTVVPLIRDEITIGRKEGNTIRLTERNVSRRHARILRNNGEVHIEDLGSYNGIRVNNSRIAERVSLRVSDQVQIGDYKLYLKAEGVEHVDDARTMPVERIDSAAPTDIMPALTGAQTVPIAVQAAPAPTPQVVGNPNRTLVAVADTDPQGRPLATAAAVAALSAPVGYGRLVVLSSNFAGKEFELSRPQMIAGRTDENDLVINHRSISRNHAKLVREPDTGRYTISDLQSSNGVRVNGQDYGKVELRRGDVIDLGHVRLRFVEPGEDFVFARDAVITDVPDVGGKKGLLVAILLGVLVLGGVVVYFMTKGGKEPDTLAKGSGSGANPAVVIDATELVVAVVPDAAAIEEQPDAAIVTNNGTNGTDDKARLNAECVGLKSTKQWKDLLACTDRLAKLDAAGAKTLRERALSEDAAEQALAALREAITANNWKLARAKYDSIKEESVYRKDAEALYKPAEKTVVDELVADLRLVVAANCKEFRTRLGKLDANHPKPMMDQVRNRAKCTVEAAQPPGCGPCPAGSTCVNGACKVTAVQPPACDFTQLKTDADAQVAIGNHAAALLLFEQALRCKPDGNTLAKAFLAACNSSNAARAKQLYPRLSPTQQGLVQRCLAQAIDPRP